MTWKERSCDGHGARESGHLLNCTKGGGGKKKQEKGENRKGGSQDNVLTETKQERT